MARVFVSHASDDGVLAGQLHQWLVAAGHEVFLAQDLRDGVVVGELWEQRLHEELRRADAVLCVVTAASVASQWCTAEAAIAWSRGSKLLPLRAEPGVTNSLLKSVQHTDYTTDPDAARRALTEALQRVDTGIEAARQAAAGWPEGRSPFPGLRPFEAEQHQVFFGRTEQIGQLAELLRSPAERAEGAVLLVVGPSGCGKSSLVRAGLVPVMADEPGWSALAPFVPGADPVGALARELAAAGRGCGLDWTPAQVRDQLDRRGLTEVAEELLVATPGARRRRLLVVVDQFEELLTQAAPAQQAQFAALLRPALTGPVQVVGTLRPEFLHPLLVSPELAGLPTHTYTLRPLRREGLRTVIEKPARLAGIDVDDGLVDRLVDDTDSGEALPLLAFTLAQLVEGITRGGRLSHARYDQLGGVQGALTRQADAALAEAVTTGGRTREQVIAGLLRLVTVDEQGRPTRWRITRDELPDPVRADLTPFITRRLLTTDTDNGTVVLGVAHEAFLSAWPPLAAAITANVSALRARRTLEQAATEWHNTGRPRERLWGGGQLTAAIIDIGIYLRAGDIAQYGLTHWLPRRRRVLVTDRVDLSAKASEFLHASIRRDRARRRRATTVLSTLLILALAAAGVAVIQQQNAEDRQHEAAVRQREATARQLIAQAELVRGADLRTALQLGLAAHYIHPDGETHASLINTLTTTHYVNTLASHTDSVLSVAFAPDGRTLATSSADNTVILWNIVDPAQHEQIRPSLTGHTDSVLSVAFAPDGRTLATSSADNTVILWNVTDPSRARPLGPPLTGHTNAVQKVAFTPDGQTLATSSNDGTVILWDVSDSARPAPLGLPLTGHTDSPRAVEFAPEGRILITGSGGDSVTLWDVSDPARPISLGSPLTRHSDKSVNSVAFSPEGHTLATAISDGMVVLWDITNLTQPSLLGHLMGSSSFLVSVAFAPDGRTLATGSQGFVKVVGRV